MPDDVASGPGSSPAAVPPGALGAAGATSTERVPTTGQSPTLGDSRASAREEGPLPAAAAGFPELVEAWQTPGSRRAWALRAWRKALRASPASPDEAAARGAALLALAQDPSAACVTGFRGWSARTVAIEALLSQGGRHALQLHPDALAELDRVRSRRWAGLSRRGLLLFLLAPPLLLLGLFLVPSSALRWPFTAALTWLVDVGVTVVGTMPLWMTVVLLWAHLSPWRRLPDVRGVD